MLQIFRVLWILFLSSKVNVACRYEHPIKGQGIYAYVSLAEGEELEDALKKELVMTVRSNIGAFAAPDILHWAPGLPKTRSGKIMRRVSLEAPPPGVLCNLSLLKHHAVTSA